MFQDTLAKNVKVREAYLYVVSFCAGPDLAFVKSSTVYDCAFVFVSTFKTIGFLLRLIYADLFLDLKTISGNFHL